MTTTKPRGDARAVLQLLQSRVELVPIETIEPDPENARTHGPKNIEALRKSLERFGQQKPIVVGKDGRVIAGNGTLEAAKALGWAEIAIVRSELEGEEAIAYAIVDNKTSDLSAFDPDVLRDQIGLLGDDTTVFFYDLDLRKLLDVEKESPDSFKSLDEDNVETTTKCPRCGHEWS